MSRGKGRRCGKCGGSYYRANRMRLWTSQNPGHRDGWAKVEEPICTNCMPENVAGRVYVLTQVRIVQGAAPKKRKRA